MALSDTLQWLAGKLYPKGRAFRKPEEGFLYRLHRAINLSIEQLLNDTKQILWSIYPDNPYFTIDDAHDWYRRLGIFDSGSVPFSDMKAAILQKLSFPTTPLNKQSAAFIQEQLQAAGFNVYVYQNKFPDGMGGYKTKTPGEIIDVTSKRSILGFFQLGENQLGELQGGVVSKIANYIEDARDQSFDPGANLHATFYIAGNPINTFASVPATRHDEFRQLILKLKAKQMLGYLFVNYV